MPAWIIPALKAILPYTGDIIDAAKPMFTKRKAGAVVDAPDIQQQIEELQSAATQNDSHIRDLAEQLKKTVAALEQGAALAERKLQWLSAVSLIALLLSAASLGGLLLMVAGR